MELCSVVGLLEVVVGIVDWELLVAYLQMRAVASK